MPKLLLYTDGGSKGNPGPAACAAVVKSADDGQTLLDEGRYLGEATNNVAEYEAVLLALELAGRLEARDIEIRSDSELLVRQLMGEYRVKNAALRRLHEKVHAALEPFTSVAIRHVPRTQNAEADRLVNETIRKHRPQGSASPAAKSKRPPSGRGGSFRLK